MSKTTDVKEQGSKKTTVVQAVKAIAVLAIICLVCCLLLALCNDLLYISEQETFYRAIKKIYPNFVEDTSFDGKLNSTFASNSNYGYVNKVYKSTDGVYVLNVTGTGGHNGGTVTLFVAVNNNDATFVGWSIDSDKGQDYLSKIPTSVQQKWYVGKRVDGDLSLGSNMVMGATESSSAINNAINMAAFYCMNALNIGSNPEGDAKTAVLELLGDNFDGYTLTLYNILSASVGNDTLADILSDDDNQIDYIFAGNGDSGSVLAYIYGKDENRKIYVLTDNGAVKSDNITGDETFVANIVANRVMSFSYETSWGTSQTAYALITNVVDGENDTKVYTVAGLKVLTTPNTYVLTVQISADQGLGKVDSITLATDGFVEEGPTIEKTNVLVSKLVGATSATVESIYTAEAQKGATQSSNLIAVAVQAALADYDANIASQD